MSNNAIGYIKLYRSIQDHWLFKEKRKFSKLEAWIDLLMLANHKDSKVVIGNEVIEVKRGQRITSIRQLCQRWGWSNTKVKQYLNLLETEGMAITESDTKKTLITIVNYDFYQGTGDAKTTENRHENDTKQTQKHTNKNDKNDKYNIPIVEIVDYLNQKAGKNFKPSTKKTQALIKARWNEGFRLEDFQKVIDVKVSQWKGDAKMDRYLRPETLFSPKFESYLNEVPKETHQSFIPPKRDRIDFSEGEDW